MITYNMTGTIRQVHVNSLFPGSTAIPPVSIGDHVAWTLHYDTNTPLSPFLGSGSGAHYYDLTYQAVSNLVDTTTGFHFYSPPNANSTTLALENLMPKGGDFWTRTELMDTRSYLTTYFVGLNLGNPDSLPTLNLANLSLTAPPFTSNPGRVMYAYKAFSFWAVTDSISLSTAPEPGSLSLFVLGAVGAIASRLRARIVGVKRRG
jgi:hypothetical protein